MFNQTQKTTQETGDVALKALYEQRGWIIQKLVDQIEDWEHRDTSIIIEIEKYLKQTDELIIRHLHN